MKKKVFLLLVGLCLGLWVLAGCGGEKDEPTQPVDANVSEENPLADFTQQDLEQIILDKGYDLTVTGVEPNDPEKIFRGQVFTVEGGGVQGKLEIGGICGEPYVCLDTDYEKANQQSISTTESQQISKKMQEMAEVSAAVLKDFDYAKFMEHYGAFLQEYQKDENKYFYNEIVGEYNCGLVEDSYSDDGDLSFLLQLETSKTDRLRWKYAMDEGTATKYTVAEYKKAMQTQQESDIMFAVIEGKLKNLERLPSGDYQGTLTDGTGNLDVQVERTAFSEKELGKNMFHVISIYIYSDENLPSIMASYE